MPVNSVSTKPALNPVHALLLGFPIALFTTALCADIAYLNTAEIQWSNFAAWAITGALVVGGLVLLWAILGLFFSRSIPFGRRALYAILIAVMWASGFVNAFQHSRDAWSSVGTLGLTLSIISTLCALAAGLVAYGSRSREGLVR